MLKRIKRLFYLLADKSLKIMDEVKKPSLGIKPFYIIVSDRIKEIREAIERRLEHNEIIPVEWVNELNHFINWEKQKLKNDFNNMPLPSVEEINRIGDFLLKDARLLSDKVVTAEQIKSIQSVVAPVETPQENLMRHSILATDNICQMMTNSFFIDPMHRESLMQTVEVLKNIKKDLKKQIKTKYKTYI